MAVAEHRHNGIVVTESGTAEAQPRGLWTQGAGGRPHPPLGQRRRSHLSAAACALLAAVILPRIAQAAEHPLGLDPNQAYGILSTAYESPHVKWAKPLAGGTIKALVLAPQWSRRETVELAERLDLDCTPWMSSGFRHVAVPAEWFEIPTPTATIDRLLRKYAADRFDVIVVGKLDWSMLPAKQRFELLRQVAERAGLVYVCPPAGHPELDLVYSRKAAPEARRSLPRASRWRPCRGSKGCRPKGSSAPATSGRDAWSPWTTARLSPRKKTAPAPSAWRPATRH